MKNRNHFGKKCSLLLMLVCALLSFGVTTGLAQDEGIDRDRFRMRFSELGVEDATIDKLYEKIINGIPLDSMLEEYSNISPTNIVQYEDGRVVKKYVYPDGSVRINEIISGKEIHVQAREIISGEGTSGSGYVLKIGDIIRDDNGLVELSFKADYVMTAYDTCQIRSVYNQKVKIFLNAGISSQEELLIERAEGTNRNPASAVFSCKVTAIGNTAASSFRLRLIVKPTGAHSEFE